MTSNLQEIIHNGVQFLSTKQRADGYMPSLRWHADSPARAIALDDAPFVTACIAYSLAHIASEPAKQLQQRALAYLQSQMTGPGLWRYWKQEPVPLPPDLDDTALCSHLLQKRNLHLRFGSNIGIILANRNDVGLFRTWVGVEQEDICPVVNANVLLYLGDRPECEAAAEALIASIAGEQAWESLYYPDHISHLHAISRALYHDVQALEPARNLLIERVLERAQADGSFGNELHTALSAIVLLNAGYSDREQLKTTAKWLVGHQNRDGSWKQCCFFTDPANRKTGVTALEFGSAALTTGFCLEALSRLDSEVF